MAGRAAFLRIDFKFFNEFQSKFAGGGNGVVLDVFGDIGIPIVEIEDLFERSDVFFGSTVALKTPAHGVAFGLIDDLHFVDIAVATLTRDSAVHVGRVIEVNVIRRFVDADPLDRFAIVSGKGRIHGTVKRGELRTVPLDVLVAIPAGIG